MQVNNLNLYCKKRGSISIFYAITLFVLFIFNKRNTKFCGCSNFLTIMVIIYTNDQIFAACRSQILSGNSVYQNHYDIDIIKTYLLDYKIIVGFIKIFKIDSSSYRNLFIYFYIFNFIILFVLK